MEIDVVRGVEGARQARGQVVIIDVLRAFTTAAFAFDAGIEEIELVGTVEEAFARPGFRMGEVGGRLIPGFDHNNSPSQLIGRTLSGRAVQRTGAGTRCAVAVEAADGMWLSSLVVAAATARALAQAEADRVTLVATGNPGNEDLAAADYLKDLLEGRQPSAEEAIQRVMSSPDAAEFGPDDSDLPAADLDCAVDVDRFDFAMRVYFENGRRVARPWSGA